MAEVLLHNHESTTGIVMTTQVCKSPLKRLKLAEVTSLSFVKPETCQWLQPTSILAD